MCTYSPSAVPPPLGFSHALHCMLPTHWFSGFAPQLSVPFLMYFAHREMLSKKEYEEICCGLQTEFLNDFLIRRAHCQMLFAFA